MTKNINPKFLLYAVIFSTVLSTAVAIQAYGAELTAQQKIASSIIRFHVLANSNSNIDQEIKMEVKSAVLEQMQPLLENAKDINETREILTDNLDTMVRIASKFADHSVSASIAKVYFPEIQYGDMTLPRGYYEAVQIKIDQGAGNNWWCVMFPMLCFVEGTAGAPTQDMEDMLAHLLTEEEFGEVFNVRFKVVDVWREGA